MYVHMDSPIAIDDILDRAAVHSDEISSFRFFVAPWIVQKVSKANL